MNRLVLAACLLLLPAAAFALDPVKRTDRIGLLRISEGGAVGTEIVEALREELLRRGYDAYTVPATFGELRDGAGADADFYVEVAGDASSTPHGDIGVNDGHVGVSVAVVVSRIAAELRVYDGGTLELLSTRELHQRSRSVLPTSIALGGRSFYAQVGLPFARWAQNRRVLRGAVCDAATAVADTIRGDE